MKIGHTFNVTQVPNRFGCSFGNLDIRKQITVVMDICGRSHQTKDKDVGNLTVKSRAYISHQLIDDLRSTGFLIKSLLNLGQRHIQSVVNLWLKAGLAAATIQTRFSTLRWLSTAIGKPGLILLPENYGIPKSAIARIYVATTDKSWTAKTDSPDSIIEEVSAKDPWVGMQLRLMKAFGLRIREAILMRVSYSNAESVLIVEEGTKGGRTRVVPVRNEEQRSVLQDATELAKKSDRGALIPPGKNLSQTLNRAYFICRKFGIFKGGAGMTPHGLRFEYANDRYEEVSGMPTSVRGKPDVYDREADAKARSTVTKELGHARLSITGAYTGARVKGRPKAT